MSTVPFNSSDSIRIVPLYQKDKVELQEPDAARKNKPAVTGKLTYRGGPLLAAVEVFTVFWGAAWESGALKDMVAKINTYFQTILQSSLLDQLTEYNTTAYTIGK